MFSVLLASTSHSKRPWHLRCIRAKQFCDLRDICESLQLTMVSRLICCSQMFVFNCMHDACTSTYPPPTSPPPGSKGLIRPYGLRPYLISGGGTLGGITNSKGWTMRSPLRRLKLKNNKLSPLFFHQTVCCCQELPEPWSLLAPDSTRNRTTSRCPWWAAM